jgi:hypothetical protein
MRAFQGCIKGRISSLRDTRLPRLSQFQQPGENGGTLSWLVWRARIEALWLVARARTIDYNEREMFW